MRSARSFDGVAGSEAAQKGSGFSSIAASDFENLQQADRARHRPMTTEACLLHRRRTSLARRNRSQLSSGSGCASLGYSQGPDGDRTSAAARFLPVVPAGSLLAGTVKTAARATRSLRITPTKVILIAPFAVDSVRTSAIRRICTLVRGVGTDIITEWVNNIPRAGRPIHAVAFGRDALSAARNYSILTHPIRFQRKGR